MSISCAYVPPWQNVLLMQFLSDFQMALGGNDLKQDNELTERKRSGKVCWKVDAPKSDLRRFQCAVVLH